MDDSLFDAAFSDDIIEENENGERPKDKVVRGTHKMGHRHLSRKASSEMALENAINWYFADGDCYHCFSFGDVDALSYFKFVLRQQRIKYAAVSTWVMAGDDILQLEKWFDNQQIDRIDFLFGEIFMEQYPEAYEAATRFARKCGGKITTFKNHSKVMAIKGERFDCLIESSANINTNPRSENTVLTVDSDLVNDYVKLFGEIKSFNHDFDDVAPYDVEKGF